MKPHDNTQPVSPQQQGAASRENAAQVARDHVNNLYGQQSPAAAAAQTQPTQQAQTAQRQQQSPAIDANQWQQYHSAWQDYYQKYYQHYYSTYARQTIERHAQTAAPATPAIAEGEAFGSGPSKPESDSATDTKNDKQQELKRLRNDLVAKARTKAKKARGSRHFVPIAAAFSVMLVFAFLQYNSILFSNVQAYISPGAIEPQNIVVDPTTDVAVGQDPKLIIPKINVNVPVVYGVGADDKSQMAAMAHGVAHWPGGESAKSVPGQAGNTVIAGHSSNDIFEAGDYKFVFAQLDKLEAGDTIYANYEGKRYTYRVTKKDIILPKGQWQSVITPTDKPMLVLVTCWPLGTAQKRMLVTAEQISPDPSAVTAAPATTEKVETTDAMTGTAPTAIEWLFNLFR